ncbi:MAG: hypothetical protein A2X57_05900 [Nitrospirae bacterium GWD2_57_8]|nr:MAG: hypothetical protein A2X57_05900 [Nitrospirae bacterium GWD2_57_8]
MARVSPLGYGRATYPLTLFLDAGFPDYRTRLLLADIRLLIVDVVTYHSTEFLAGNIGHDFEYFPLEIVCSLDCSFIDFT